MTPPSLSLARWADDNQAYLVAALARLRSALVRYAAGERPWPAEGNTEREELAARAAAMEGAPALESARVLLGLSPFELDVLLLCAGVELEGDFRELCAKAHRDARCPYPTFSLALAVLAEPHWSALAPTAPLRRLRLVHLCAGDTLVHVPLRIDERILHYLTGVPSLDEQLLDCLEPVVAIAAPPLVPSHQAVAERAVIMYRMARGAHYPTLQLTGRDATAQRAIAREACERMNLSLHALRAADVPRGVTDRENLCRLWNRESVLSASALLVDVGDTTTPDTIEAACSLLLRLPGIVFVAAREPIALPRSGVVTLEVPPISSEEQPALWREALGQLGVALDAEIERVAFHFQLGADAIHATALALVGESASDGHALASRFWDACRTRARTRLDELAQRIAATASWDDLVLPAAQRELLFDIARHVRNRHQVYQRWGFRRRSVRGLGISALFAGPSGTGKTMAAEVLSLELRLDLYRIDLSQVVNKYIGETEKNLRRVFDAAEESGAILLFDEADALFGRRSDVKDSHDRYANIEVSYLLQRMEAYRGLAVLTTNRRDALDDAFLRRLRFVVEFPFPDVAERTRIWQVVFPAETPTEQLDVARLARLKITGGSIRNIALQAAFLAADAGEAIGMSHLVRAARHEYVKLEKPLPDADIAGWT